MKKLTIFNLAISVIVIFFVILNFKDSSYMSKERINIDSLLKAHDTALKDMRRYTDSLKEEKNKSDERIDSTLNELINHTEVIITDGTITEALLWIEDYNDSLQSW